VALPGWGQLGELGGKNVREGAAEVRGLGRGEQEVCPPGEVPLRGDGVTRGLFRVVVTWHQSTWVCFAHAPILAVRYDSDERRRMGKLVITCVSRLSAPASELGTLHPLLLP